MIHLLFVTPVGSQSQFVDTSRAVQPESATNEHTMTAAYQVPMLPPNEQAAFPESEQMLPRVRFSYGCTDEDTSSGKLYVVFQFVL